MESNAFIMARSPEDCMSVLPHNGREYVEFSCLIPWLGKSYMSWEKEYFQNYGYKIHEFITGGSTLASLLPPMIVALYLSSIIFGQRYMKDQKPWEWKKKLALWNLFLSLFSFMGMVRMVPPLIYMSQTKSIRSNMCDDPYATWLAGSTGTWVQFFILSKIPELFDTFFVVVRKKPLIFLHWYHHITVLLYVWHGAYAIINPVAPIFGAMNYGVHSLMYGYYFLMAIGKKPKWLHASIITSAQILQMWVGMVATAIGYHYYMDNRRAVEEGNENSCLISGWSLVAAMMMYGSYFLLFIQFFIARFTREKRLKVTSKNLKTN
mmetsp:Transcript_32676/g.39707  ORF Transcript_32676/g.39707 Transcript_32676/m.39707 type:complete len:321 (+) Transcript_32676:158-1120(+)